MQSGAVRASYLTDAVNSGQLIVPTLLRDYRHAKNSVAHLNRHFLLRREAEP
jgi:hypothetical protein